MNQQGDWDKTWMIHLEEKKNPGETWETCVFK